MGCSVILDIGCYRPKSHRETGGSNPVQRRCDLAEKSRRMPQGPPPQGRQDVGDLALPGKPDRLNVIQITSEALNPSYVPGIKTPCTPCWRNREEQAMTRLNGLSIVTIGAVLSMTAGLAF